MTVFYVDRVILKVLESDGTYTAVSINGSSVYNKCYFMRENPDNVTYSHVGRHALLLTLDNQNFILGYYTDTYEEVDHKIYLEGQQIFRSGESRAFIIGDDGYIGIYYIQRQADGSLKQTPKIQYSADDALSTSFSELLMAMTDASMRVEATTDENGFKHYAVEAKGRGDDAGYRYKHNIDGTAQGINVKTMIDVSNGPKRVAMEPAEAMLAKKVSISHTPDIPMQILLTLASIPNMSFKVDATGSVEISCGPNLSPAKITMGSDGKIEINGISGIDIKGTGISLIETIKNFINNEYKNHTHPTAVGPTGIVVPPSGSIAAQQLDILKG